MKTRLFAKTTSLILLLSLGFSLSAKHKIKTSATATGADLAPNRYIFAYVDRLSSTTNAVSSAEWIPPGNPPSDFMNFDFMNTVARVRLELKEGEGVCYPDEFTVTIGLSFKKYSSSFTFDPIAGGTRYVTVNYNKNQGITYKNKDLLQFSDVYFLSTKIISISNPNAANYIKLTTELEYDEFRNPIFFEPLILSNEKVSPIISISEINSNNDVKIEYTHSNTSLQDWADSIELEWTWITEDQYYQHPIDNYLLKKQIYGNNSIQFNFNNSSRIILPAKFGSGENNYIFSNAFDNGYLIVRARFIGNVLEKQIINGQSQVIGIHKSWGPWSIPDNDVFNNHYTIPSTYNSSSPSPDQYILNSYILKINRFAGNLNWQYNIEFAEDGKKKESIAYFDGLLRQRQSIVKSNTNNFTIVSDMIYDYEGRPTISALPVPFSEYHLGLKTSLYKNLNNQPYSAKDFDKTDICDFSPSGMNNNSGAGNYYSEQNQYITGNNSSSFQNFIPTSGDQNGYFPFSQVVYMPDHTGRVKMQTMPGQNHKLGTGKETQNFYGRPLQPEIDRLFGNEIGFAEHYQKEMVKDPNGQLSISIKNLEGKVVATALAGTPSSATNPLNSSSQMQEITIDLLQAPSNAEYSRYASEKSVIFNTNIQVDLAGPHYFKYSLTPATYAPSCSTETEPLFCLDCIYDLEISIKNSCNEEMIEINGQGGLQNGVIKKTISPGTINNTCSSTPYGYASVSDNQLPTNSAPIGFFTVNLPIGDYTITRKLVVNEESLVKYREQVLSTVECKSLEQFEDEELDKLSDFECNPCLEYVEYQANPTQSKSNYVTAKLAEFNISISDPSYNSKMEEIAKHFDDMMLLAKEVCDGIFDPCFNLLNLMKEDVSPQGLYGIIPSSTPNSNYSVFQNAGPNLTFRDLPYFNSNYGLNSSGQSVLLSSLTVQELIGPENWKDEFKDYLVVLHPEYARYVICKEQEIASRQFDQKLIEVITYEKALAAGYIDETAGIINFGSDPLLLSTSNASILNNYVNTNFLPVLAIGNPSTLTLLGPHSMFNVCVFMVFCKEANVSQIPNCISFFSISNIMLCNKFIKDVFWLKLRSLYLAAKQKSYEDMLSNWLNTNPTHNVNPTFSFHLNNQYALKVTSPARYNIDPLIPSTPAGNNTEVINQCKDICEAYADTWMAQLANCNFSSDPSIAATQKSALRNGLINVCQEGCDEKNPIGASSVRPTSAATQRSFKHVIEDLGLLSMPLCSDALIKIPTKYSNEPFEPKPTTFRSLEIPRCGTEVSNCLIYSPCPNIGLLGSCDQYNPDLNKVGFMLAKKLPKDCPPNQICRSCEDIRVAYDKFYKYNTIEETNIDFEKELTKSLNKDLSFNLAVGNYTSVFRNCIGVDSTLSLSEILQEFRYVYKVYKYSGHYLGDMIVSNYMAPSRDLRWASLSQKSTNSNLKNSFTIQTPSPISTESMPFGVITASSNLGEIFDLKSEFAPIHTSAIFSASPPSSFKIPLNSCACNSLMAKFNLFSAQNTYSSFEAYLLATLGIAIPNALDLYRVCKIKWDRLNEGLNPSEDPPVTTREYDSKLRGQPKVPCELCSCDNPPPVNPPPPPPAGGGTPPNPGVGIPSPIIGETPRKNEPDPCSIFRNEVTRVLNSNNFSIDDFLTYGTQSGLAGLYNTIILQDTSNKYARIDNTSLVFLLEWFRRYMKECQVGNFVSLNDCNKNCAGGYTTKPTTAPACSTCYAPDKRLLLLQRYINKMANTIIETTPVVGCNILPEQPNNQLAKKKVFYNTTTSQVPQYYNQNALYYPIGANFSSSLRHKAEEDVPEEGGVAVLNLEIDDKNGFVKDLALSMITNKDYPNGFDYIVKVFDIQNIQVANCPNNIRFFSAKALLFVPKGECGEFEYEEREISGTYSDILIKPINCNVKDYRICVEKADPCVASKMQLAKLNARLAYDQYKTQLLNDLEQNYINTCLGVAASGNEVFMMKSAQNAYHYTLYYYDAAGNLVKTVPPQGVYPLSNLQVVEIAKKRANQSNTAVDPTHKMPTTYHYNSLNQLVWQQTPDAGISKFGYDRVGRLILSQNSKQAAKALTSPPQFIYSYTQFDPLGRIVEVGQLTNAILNQNGGALNNADLLEDENYVLSNIIESTQKSEITRTYYDDLPSGLAHGYILKNHLGRVSASAYFSSYATQVAASDHAVLYNYDPQGNVNQIIRYVKGLSILDNQFKSVEYQFDVISGKVENVIYQGGMADQYMHHYEYDAENRLVRSYSSIRKELISPTPRNVNDKRGMDASYQYYYHGPLARTELGELQVQGLDYAYTLQGWLKGVNAAILTGNNDIGKDGQVIGANSSSDHRDFARDEMGFVLSYYDNDYGAVNQSSTALSTYPFDPAVTATNTAFNGYLKNLYNGNIRMMYTSIKKFNTNNLPLLSAYQYDQLNRLAEAKYFDYSNNSTIAQKSDWNNIFSYDANGNILTQKRNGSNGMNDLDNLKYYYKAYTTGTSPSLVRYSYDVGGNMIDESGTVLNLNNIGLVTNQLDRVNDLVTASNYSDDIDDQGNGINYKYDEIGNLIYDASEQIEKIDWNVYGKIKRITRFSNSEKPDLEFEYTPDGHRVAKIVIPKNDQPSTYTYYIRDAQGNVLATYTRTIKRTVDYANLTFANVNNRIISQQSIESFAWFTAQLHANNTYGTSSFLNSIKNDYILNTSAQSSNFLLNYSINLSNLLNHPNNLSTARLLFNNFQPNTLLDYAFETGMLDVEKICQCMDARKIANGNFVSFQEYLMQNLSLREAFLDLLMNTNHPAYLQLLSDLAIPVSFTAQELLDINAYISINGISALMNSLQNSINFSSCGGILRDFVLGLPNAGNPLLIDELSAIPEFNELIWNTGLGSVSFTCVQDPYSEWLNMLSYRDPALMMNLLIEHAPGASENDRKSWIVNWLMVNDSYQFLYTASLMDHDAIAASQTTNEPLYASSAGAPDMQQYFEKIEQIYGNSFYDQMFAYFSSSSNLYVDSLKVNEFHIYGSSRLGVYESNSLIAWRNAYDANNDNQLSESEYSIGNANNTGFLFASLSGYRGKIRYEMSNHLGNVLTVVSDKKLSVCSNGTFVSFAAEVISATDYSPFGAPLAGRTFSSESYRYRFNGQEQDNEIAGIGNIMTAEFWMYDARLGRRWNMDPVVHEEFSPFCVLFNSPIQWNDPFGDDPPKRLSLASRVWNGIRGRGYENRANRFAVENNIDERRIHIDRENGNIIIDQWHYEQRWIRSDKKGGLRVEAVIVDETVIFSRNKKATNTSLAAIPLIFSPDPTLTKFAAGVLLISATYIALHPPPPIIITHPVQIYLPQVLLNENDDKMKGGKRNTRDRDYGIKDKDFWRWWHRKGKPGRGGKDIGNKGEADEIFNDWINNGKPKAK